MEQILIYDIHNLCKAAEHGTTPMYLAPFGDITALYSGLRSILRVGKDNQNHWDYVYACFDSTESLRKEVRPNYKSNRDISSQRGVFNTQMSYLFTVLKSLGFSCIRMDGFEADDIIAELCGIHNDANKLIVSNDKDLYQLLDDKTSLYKRSGRIYKKYFLADFIKEYDISPSEWATVKAIAGCRTDVVDGIPTIGEVRAISYLKKTLNAKYRELIESNYNVVTGNLPLVQLPYRRELMPIIPMKPFNFNFDNLRKVVDMFSFNSISGIELMEWRNAWTR